MVLWVSEGLFSVFHRSSLIDAFVRTSDRFGLKNWEFLMYIVFQRTKKLMKSFESSSNDKKRVAVVI